MAGIDRAVAAGETAASVAARIGRSLARRQGLDPDALDAPQLLRRGLDPDSPADDAVEEAPGLDVWVMGSAYERALDVERRTVDGIHYTPRSLASGLARIAIHDCATARVCDPSVGGGAFLLAAAEQLESLGVSVAEIVAERLWGIDLDPDAVAVARAALALWASREGRWHVPPPAHMAVGDTLESGRDAFADPPPFEVVLGNPPFQGQLAAATARSVEAGRRLRERWCIDAGPYADSAAYFLLAALELAAEDATVCLVQPQSLLVTADSAPVRRRLLSATDLVGLWVGDNTVFDADVHVCAPILARPAAAGASVRRWEGVELSPRRPVDPPTGPTWGPLVADLRGAPLVEPVVGARLGDDASATAGFRDQFYGLAAHAHDTADGDDPPIVTVGMIDPLRCRWGTADFRYAGRKWRHPRLDVAALAASDPRLAGWVSDRRCPKLLVATQTKTIEVVVDEAGALVPSTPVIALVPPADRLWHVAAALSSPVLAAVAFARVAGAALSADTIKLSARQLLDLPLPPPSDNWDRAADLVRRAHHTDDLRVRRGALELASAPMCAAYGIAHPDALVAWWRERLPPVR